MTRLFLTTAFRSPRRTAFAQAPPTSPARELVNKYCVSCHNQKLKTAGLALDRVDATSLQLGERPGRRSSSSCAAAPCRRPASPP